jgi:hypothetical protein
MEAGPEDRFKGTIFIIYKPWHCTRRVEAAPEDRLKGTIFVIYKPWHCTRRVEAKRL